MWKGPLLLLALLPGLLIVGCDGDDPVDPNAILQAWFDTSLHGTRQGMETWYAASNGGFETLTGVPYDTLACQDCHNATRSPDWTEPSCLDCHDVLGDTPAESVCLGCHGRQNGEIGNGPGDYHRDTLNYECIDCHEADTANGDELHGDGNTYVSQWDPGAFKTSCEDCHPLATLPANDSHDTHLNTVDCSACHMQAAISCLNCHFDTAVAGGGNVAHRQVHDWIFLVNRNNKVAAGTMMTLKYQNDTFAVIAPFYGHTIAKNARDCNDCHMAQALQDYNSTGMIDVLTWNANDDRLDNMPGVIPVTQDYQTAMNVDFADYDGSTWSFLEPGPDMWQMLSQYATPLTPSQLSGLNRFALSLHTTSRGMEEWYKTSNGGFESQTNVAYDSLQCKNCHDPSNTSWVRDSCYDCHTIIGDSVVDATCLPCHGRQNAEILNGPGDYHRDTLTYACTRCHQADVAAGDEYHGDGTIYPSMWTPGAFKTACEDCHDPAQLDNNNMHNQHLDNIHCTACHMQSSTSCINCHFDTAVAGGGNVAHRQVHDWKFLINRDGKVRAGTIMTLKYTTGMADETFAVIAPFYGHTISRTAITNCNNCHNNANVLALKAGTLQLLTWNSGASRLDNVTGIIPVPPDYQTEFVVDFADWDGMLWTFLETGPDNWQMLSQYGSPLTAAQMLDLELAISGGP